MPLPLSDIPRGSCYSNTKQYAGTDHVQGPAPGEAETASGPKLSYKCVHMIPHQNLARRPLMKTSYIFPLPGGQSPGSVACV